MVSKLSAPYFDSATSTGEQLSTAKDAKDLLIILGGQGEIASEYKKLLTNILAAVKYNFDSDIYLIHSADVFYDLIPACRKKGITKVLIFDKPLKKLGLKSKEIAYSLFTIGEINFILSHSLQKLHTDNSLKNKLWTAMKKMFFDEKA